ncbi:helix-turn-helix domain-containing protein [Asanoa sp. NPDC049518]|uniref:helix-turn-helix domain-containing protein n=1 Tax=unclassified Asanoa TaxID=2685164 RepID=UPI00341565FE
MSLEAIGALREPARRAVYEFVVSRAEPVSRNEVAEGVGIGRTLAAFHLDKLAEAGRGGPPSSTAARPPSTP